MIFTAILWSKMPRNSLKTLVYKTISLYSSWQTFNVMRIAVDCPNFGRTYKITTEEERRHALPDIVRPSRLV